MKKIISAILTLILAAGIAIGGNCGKAGLEASAEDYTITFGSYPQSLVTNKSTISALNGISGTWTSYDYFSGDDSIGSMKASDYMRYKDVIYNGTKYRAVTFDEERPGVTFLNFGSQDQTAQNCNGYYAGNVYWFKYEALEWRVLDSQSGLVMSSMIIDAQPYSNFVYECASEYYSDAQCRYYESDYEKSSIREWLNNDFLNCAFTGSEQENILFSTLNNYSPYDSKYNSPNTNDKIFLLSFDDLINNRYGFENDYTACDYARQMSDTDYANCQGNFVYDSGNSWWWLRNPYDSRSAFAVTSCGASNYYCTADMTAHGVVPAMRLKSIIPGVSTYTVSYNANGGSNVPAPQTEIVGNGTYVSPVIPTKQGFVFMGWADGSMNSTEMYYPGDEFKTDSDITLYAIWTAEAKTTAQINNEPVKTEDTGIITYVISLLIQLINYLFGIIL